MDCTVPFERLKITKMIESNCGFKSNCHFITITVNRSSGNIYSPHDVRATRQLLLSSLVLLYTNIIFMLKWHCILTLLLNLKYWKYWVLFGLLVFSYLKRQNYPCYSCCPSVIKAKKKKQVSPIHKVFRVHIGFEEKSNLKGCDVDSLS